MTEEVISVVSDEKKAPVQNQKVCLYNPLMNLIGALIALGIWNLIHDSPNWIKLSVITGVGVVAVVLNVLSAHINSRPVDPQK